VALTAHALRGIRKECLAHGMDDYLGKPLRRAGLLEKVDAWLDHGSAPRESTDPALDAGSPVVLIDPDLADLVPEFLESCRAEAARLTAALEADDLQALQRTGHNLKGSGSGYGFDRISEIGGMMESAARDGNRVALQAAVTALADYLATVKYRSAD
jgi:HPt (histidine-containing phosphotransfer) domain-containing protein